MNRIDIIKENQQRHQAITPYDPIEGTNREGYLRVSLSDAPIACQYIPARMIEEQPLAKKLVKFTSIEEFCRRELGGCVTSRQLDEVWCEWIQLRIKYDFEFWAAMYVTIKDKLGEQDIPFLLNRPQRRLLERLELMRCADRPIRLILLKARQWGGSTLVQIYMAWIQLVHRRNWNSVICAHLKDAAANIKGMYTKLLSNYPLFLCQEGRAMYFQPFERSSNTSVIEQRGCRVTIGSAETPESIRGSDTVMAHLSEVAFWSRTPSKSPESLIRSVCGSIAMIPYSLIVLESTANGTGTYFHQEYLRAKQGRSDKEALFVAWYEIEMYTLPILDYELFIDQMTDYEWSLWKRGATLEAINWYRHKRREYNEHADMMAEYPSDDVEAFNHSGERVFDLRQVERLRSRCCPPVAVGELYAQGCSGKEALQQITFAEKPGAPLCIWAYPSSEEDIAGRYIVVVDIGGRSRKSDYSVIAVFDRYWMMEGGVPEIVAQWRGHVDHDLLAWQSAQMAIYYHKALLVIESNTLETENTDGEHAEFILDTIARHYNNLYARVSTQQINPGMPVRWGFHTNRSTKTMVINHQINMLREEGYIERDTQACHEHDVYERKSNGAFGAIEGEHDDILMTRCIGNYICYNEPLPKLKRR